jgi:polysaccharide export outer membrane protein
MLLLLPVAFAFGSTKDYPIGPRDQLQIVIHGFDKLSGDYRVNSNGEADLPWVGKVNVSGLTVSDAGDVLSRRYADGYLVDPHITVSVVEHLSQPIEVYGAVAKPGLYYLQGVATVREILGEAGWIQVEKSNGQILVQRGDEGTLTLMVEDLLSGRGNIELRANDVVTLPEGQFIYVDGEVEKPGAILFADGLTVSQALTRAGGPSTFGNLRKAYLLRDGERIEVNIKRILGGRDADIEMSPGDQLFVKSSTL